MFLKGSFDPHLLVLLAYSLAVADWFPEEFIREIFSIDFLGRLDAQLESMPPFFFCHFAALLAPLAIHGSVTS